jgi:hypothetical protein
MALAKEERAAPRLRHLDAALTRRDGESEPRRAASEFNGRGGGEVASPLNELQPPHHPP